MKNNVSSIRTPSPRQSADKSSPKRGTKPDNQNQKLQGGCKAAKPCTKGGETIVKQEENYLARCTNFRLTTGYELSICNCKHIRKIRIGERHSIVNPQRWLCETCLSTESVWACLSCPKVACGRFIKEHALTHFQESGHPLVIDVNELYVFCYKCDDYVLNDNNSSDIKVLRETLLAIRYQNFTGTTRSGHTLRSAMITEQVDVEMRRQMQQDQLDRDDRLFTAIWHSRFVRQRKAFRRWVRYIHWKRSNSKFPSESSDEEEIESLKDDAKLPNKPDLETSFQESVSTSLPLRDTDINLTNFLPPCIDGMDEEKTQLLQRSLISFDSDTTDTDISGLSDEKPTSSLSEENVEMDISFPLSMEAPSTTSDGVPFTTETLFLKPEPSEISSTLSAEDNIEHCETLSTSTAAQSSSAENLPSVNHTAEVVVDVMMTNNLIADDVVNDGKDVHENSVPTIPLNILSRPKRSNAASRYKEIFGSLKGTMTPLKREASVALPKYDDGEPPEKRRMSLRPRPSGRRSDRIKKINKKKERQLTAAAKKKVVKRKPVHAIKLTNRRQPSLTKRKNVPKKKVKPRTTKNSMRSIQSKQKRKMKQVNTQATQRTRRLISASGARQERKRLNSYRPPSLYDNIPNKAVTSLIPGVTGLRNLGNTCYLNSIIQVLGHLQKFRLCLFALRELEFREAFALASKEVFSKNKLNSDNFVVATPQSKPARPINRRTTVELYNEQNKPTPLSVRNCDRVKSGLNGGQSSLNGVAEPLLPVTPPSPGRRNHKSPTSGTEPDHWSSSLSLCNELDHLYQVMWSGKWKLVSPYHFLHSVWSLIPSFRGYTQQDAQEFLCELLDKIVSELERCRQTENKSALRILEVVQKVFEGRLKSRVRCLECGHVSATVEPFWDLSLEFPERYHKINSTKRRPSTNSKTPQVPVDTCTLHEMLQNFTAPETLEGGRVYGCSKCNFHQQTSKNNPTTPGPSQKKRPSFRKNSQKLTEAEKQLKVLELPQVLRFHLKRFRWIGRNHREKISVHVDFPSELDMRPYCWKSENDCTNDEQYMYDLSSVVIHHGRGFGSGHYTANCWNDIGEFWVHCNDSNLELRSIEDVMTSQAYILFYTQRGLDPQPHILSPPQTPKVASPTHANSSPL